MALANHLHTALLDGLHYLPCVGNIVCVFESLDFLFGELSDFRVGESAKLVVLPENPILFLVRFVQKGLTRGFGGGLK